MENNYLLSHHDDKNFKCTDVNIVSSREAESLTLGPGEKLTLIKRRRFRDQEAETPVYVSIRKKPPAAKVLKLLRKN